MAEVYREEFDLFFGLAVIAWPIRTELPFLGRLYFHFQLNLKNAPRRTEMKSVEHSSSTLHPAGVELGHTSRETAPGRIVEALVDGRDEHVDEVLQDLAEGDAVVEDVVHFRPLKMVLDRRKA
jgi:hypothetical protein